MDVTVLVSMGYICEWVYECDKMLVLCGEYLWV